MAQSIAKPGVSATTKVLAVFGTIAVLILVAGWWGIAYLDHLDAVDPAYQQKLATYEAAKERHRQMVMPLITEHHHAETPQQMLVLIQPALDYYVDLGNSQHERIDRLVRLRDTMQRAERLPRPERLVEMGEAHDLIRAPTTKLEVGVPEPWPRLLKVLTFIVGIVALVIVMWLISLTTDGD